MITKTIQINPSLIQWYDSLKLQRINFFKHDLYSGHIIATIFQKIFGDKFETRSMTNDTSIKNALHNWTRIIELQTKLDLPKIVKQEAVHKIVNSEDETALHEIMIQLYEIATKQTYQRLTIKQLPGIKKALPQTLSPIPINTIAPDPHAAIPTNRLNQPFPENVPMFCRTSYPNSRRLIEHLSKVCSDSITQQKDIAEYIEMLDPRADICYPFFQLLVKLPADYAVPTMNLIASNLSLELVVQCILEDFTLFYDLATLILRSTIALNIVGGDSRRLFDVATDFLCAVVISVKRASEDTVYLIYHDVLLQRIVPETPLVNFSLTHFFRLCLSCTNQLSPALMQQLIAISLANLKQSQPLVSENRLRFEILVAFTSLAEETGKYKDQIARAAVRYSLHGELLRDSEKFVALDLMARCIALCPPVLGDIEFPFFRLVNVLVNEIHVEENILNDFETKLQITTRGDFELEFVFDRVFKMNYEQVLFLLKLLHKLEVICPHNQNIRQVAAGLELRLVTDQRLPPCHFFCGVASVLRRNHRAISELSERFRALNGSPLMHQQKFSEDMNAHEQVNALVLNGIDFLVKHPEWTAPFFSLLNAEPKQKDVLQDFFARNQLNKGLFMNKFVQMRAGEESEEVILKQKLPDHIYANIITICQTQRLAIVAPLFTMYLSSQDLGISASALLFQFLVVNGQPAEFIYQLMSDELFSSTLAEEKQLSNQIIDIVTLLLVELSMLKKLQANQEDVRTTLQALLDCCFGYGRKDAEAEKRQMNQERCIRLLNQLKQDVSIRAILVDMFEKMDYETFGNDQLEKLITEVAGDV